MMNSKTIENIASKIGRQFPEVSGSRPKVTQQKSARATNFLLTFSGKAAGPGGKRFNRRVRVVANENGKILKVSSSK
jgi:hypothetical protein